MSAANRTKCRCPRNVATLDHVAAAVESLNDEVLLLRGAITGLRGSSLSGSDAMVKRPAVPARPRERKRRPQGGKTRQTDDFSSAEQLEGKPEVDDSSRDFTETGTSTGPTIAASDSSASRGTEEERGKMKNGEDSAAIAEKNRDAREQPIDFAESETRERSIAGKKVRYSSRTGEACECVIGGDYNEKECRAAKRKRISRGVQYATPPEETRRRGGSGLLCCFKCSRKREPIGEARKAEAPSDWNAVEMIYRPEERFSEMPRRGKARRRRGGELASTGEENPQRGSEKSSANGGGEIERNRTEEAKSSRRDDSPRGDSRKARRRRKKSARRAAKKLEDSDSAETRKSAIKGTNDSGNSAEKKVGKNRQETRDRGETEDDPAGEESRKRGRRVASENRETRAKMRDKKDPPKSTNDGNVSSARELPSRRTLMKNCLVENIAKVDCRKNEKNRGRSATPTKNYRGKRAEKSSDKRDSPGSRGAEKTPSQKFSLGNCLRPERLVCGKSRALLWPRFGDKDNSASGVTDSSSSASSGTSLRDDRRKPLSVRSGRDKATETTNRRDIISKGTSTGNNARLSQPSKARRDQFTNSDVDNSTRDAIVARDDREDERNGTSGVTNSSSGASRGASSKNDRRKSVRDAGNEANDGKRVLIDKSTDNPAVNREFTDHRLPNANDRFSTHSRDFLSKGTSFDDDERSKTTVEYRRDEPIDSRARNDVYGYAKSSGRISGDVINTGKQRSDGRRDATTQDTTDKDLEKPVPTARSTLRDSKKASRATSTCQSRSQSKLARDDSVGARSDEKRRDVANVKKRLDACLAELKEIISDAMMHLAGNNDSRGASSPKRTFCRRETQTGR